MTARSRLRTVAKWSLRVVMTLVALLLTTAAGVYAVSTHDLGEHYTVPTHALDVVATPETIERGRHLTTIKGCVDCHAENMGGQVMVDDPAFGRLAAPNVTMGGRGKELTDQDWERAVRHGVRRDGTPLFVMPADEFTTMSDEDLAAIVAYVRSLPAIGVVQPGSKAGPLLRALQTFKQMDVRPAAKIDHAVTHLAHIDVEPTAVYGKYLAAGCTGCHGTGFGGGKIPGAPPEFKPAANITPTGIGHYTEADFTRLLRTGMRPSGVPVDSAMPYKLYKQMTDTEITAVYRFLRTVPPKEYGSR